MLYQLGSRLPGLSEIAFLQFQRQQDVTGAEMLARFRILRVRFGDDKEAGTRGLKGPPHWYRSNASSKAWPLMRITIRTGASFPRVYLYRWKFEFTKLCIARHNALAPQRENIFPI